MDVTPQLIEQIDFAEKFRGYDPDQVDDFLERVGAAIAELTKNVHEATQRAERAEADLRNLPDAGRTPVAAMSDEEEAMQSTRTLMMAKRTADAAIADAREEAQKLVADARGTADQQVRDARTEADRIVGEARVAADQMTQKATAEANREYGARRDQILAEIGDLENRKVGVAGQLAAIEARLSEYRSGLSTIHGAISDILENPEAALRSPIPGVDLAAAARPAAPSFESTRSIDHATPGVEHGSAGVAEADAGHDAHGIAPAFSGSTADESGEVREAFGDATLLHPDDLAVAYSESTTEMLTTADLSWGDDSAQDASSADPWGPGSWGEVSAFADSATPGPEGEAFDYAGATTTETTAFSDFPSEGLPVIGQDRYNRDLDQAVNEPAGHDDAMTAFFEGDDEPQTRRFGRRR